MKVLLIKDIKNIGKMGDIKEVKDGYAQNYLIPNKLAKAATKEAINKYNADIRQKAELAALDLAEANLLAKSLQEITLKITAKVGQNNQLFGSLTKDEIATALEANHRIKLDKKLFDLPHIKTTGEYEISVKLGHGVHSSLKVSVVKE